MKSPVALVLGLLGALSFAETRPAGAAEPGGPLALELRVTDQGPLRGLFGLVLAYDRGGLLSGGVGMGVGHWQNNPPPLGLFGRARILRFGRFAFGFEGSLSREYHVAYTSSGINLGSFDYAYAVWTSDPSYRADLQAFAEVSGGAWSLRFQAGAGVRLTSPDCSFTGGTNSGVLTTVPCSESPAVYGWDRASDRFLRPISLVVERRFDIWPASSESSADPRYRSPDTAYRLSLYATILPVLVGSAAIATGVYRDQSDGTTVRLGIASIVLGTALGPSVGYFYARDLSPGIRHGFLRVLGGVTLALVTVPYLENGLWGGLSRGYPAITALSVAGAATGIAVVVSSISDIAHVREATDRQNARHGVPPLAVVPLVAQSGAQFSSGLALAGQF